ncbi:PREDICTED: protein disulfide-isomerase 5-4-like [Lupinus angustifolius]|uniref:protein disulfide-isomerase 5-4-like n=1 Tax=Lupinus angustifolius TaxID=3871 RepID=UPI00092E7561|nr:PREDICTED: protein disulfide-isomerase 5-4-like [Lupinus angustifolius]
MRNIRGKIDMIIQKKIGANTCFYFRTEHGHEHESYYGDRDTESLVKMLENLVISLHTEPQKPALEDKSTAANKTKRQAPTTGGCRVEGHVRVKKVPGELIISARSDAHSFDASQMNMSHVINHLYFGRSITPKTMHDVNILLPYIGSSHDRLKGRSFINTRDLEGNITIEHYIQVVKTEVISKTGSRLVEEYEYTAHSSVAHSVDIPVAKFHLELSPMQVSITENQKSFSHFITNVCAIIGGVFTVAGILDSILHNTIKVIKKKVELGKNF